MLGELEDSWPASLATFKTRTHYMIHSEPI